MKFKAVIFDLDGTLLNTIDDIADCINYALSKHAFPTHPLEAHYYFVGSGTREMVMRALPRDVSGEQADAVLADYQTRYALHQNDKTRPYEGVPEMLKALNEDGVPVAVLSNKPHVSTLAVCAYHFDGISLRAVLGQREGVPVKPDPAGAIELTELLGVRPEEILYVGDSDVDMQTAVSAGMYPLGALWGFRKREELVLSGAKTVLEKPLDVLSFIREK